jgi:hypothetical protein
VCVCVRRGSSMQIQETVIPPTDHKPPAAVYSSMNNRQLWHVMNNAEAVNGSNPHSVICGHECREY